jgi:hypothetical protein
MPDDLIRSLAERLERHEPMPLDEVTRALIRQARTDKISIAVLRRDIRDLQQLVADLAFRVRNGR